jgi:hypothetical protein
MEVVILLGPVLSPEPYILDHSTGNEPVLICFLASENIGVVKTSPPF